MGAPARLEPLSAPLFQNTAGRLAALALLAPLFPACSAIGLNYAMEEVNSRYTDLFYDIESADALDIRASARRLNEALSEPRIADFRAEDPDYQRLLDATRAATRAIEEQASLSKRRESERESLLALRARLFQSCQDCHGPYRRR